MDSFAHWYNHEHRHTGIGLHTPADVHYGLAADRAVDRQAVLAAARARYPHRFATTTPTGLIQLEKFRSANGGLSELRLWRTFGGAA